jgi:CPA1 family monovalent cation:H+ antiporter
MSSQLQVELLILAVLLIASIVSVIVRRFRIPYTAALVLAGLVISFRSTLQIQLTSDLILSLLLPPLLFEAAFHLSLDELRRNLRLILLLAIPGVLLSTLLVGQVVAWGAGLPLSVALVFGALIAATDPVAVVAIFRKLGAPKRLQVLLEGESLLNDGTAIVLFNLAVVAAVTGQFQLVEGLADFVRVSGGGILVGLVLGLGFSWLIARIPDYLVVTTLSTVLAFGSYLVAEQFHFSGVLAVVSAGLVTGNSEREMSPSARIVVLNFWEYVAFLANSAVFLLIGFRLDVERLFTNWHPVLWAILAVLASRAVNVYLLSRLGGTLPGRWRHVLFWGGLRGAIALALVLSLPESLGPDRTTVVEMALGVVLFSTVGQGISMDWLVRRLRLATLSEQEFEYERRQARAMAALAGLEHLQQLHQDGLFSSHTWEQMKPVLQRRVKVLTSSVQEVLHGSPEIELQELNTAQREALRAQRSMLAHMRREGLVSEPTYEELVAEVDLAFESLDEGTTLVSLAAGAPQEVKGLLLAVVQDRDLESASNALAVRGVTSTTIRSHGAFLRQSSHLLLVGVPEGRLEAAVGALQSSTHERVEFLPSLPVLVEGPLPEPSPIHVHGATVFLLPVERYEVI